MDTTNGRILIGPPVSYSSLLRLHRCQPSKRTLARNAGGVRTFVACSNAYAYRISVSSLHAAPMNEMPTGKPKMVPAGTVMFGVPATAAGDELPPELLRQM